MDADAISYENRDGYLYANFPGEFTAENNIALFRAVLDECQRLGSRRVLADLASQTGSMSLLSRFHLGEFVSQFWDPTIRLAALGRPDQIDHEHFAVTVARNRGMVVEVFSDESKALAWLLG